MQLCYEARSSELSAGWLQCLVLFIQLSQSASVKPVVLCSLCCSSQGFYAAYLVQCELCMFCVAPRHSAKGCGGVRGQVPTSLTYLDGLMEPRGCKRGVTEHGIGPGVSGVCWSPLDSELLLAGQRCWSDAACLELSLVGTAVEDLPGFSFKWRENENCSLVKCHLSSFLPMLQVDVLVN